MYHCRIGRRLVIKHSAYTMARFLDSHPSVKHVYCNTGRWTRKHIRASFFASYYSGQYRRH